MGCKTKIDWCDSTWNPVTGCLHGCEYCYARSIAHRFSGGSENQTDDRTIVLDEKVYGEKQGKAVPYPYGFIPTFHRYRLNDYTDRKGRNIFVCSMADLFGSWIADSWIKEVFNACRKAPQHNYLFLTKNPQRYIDLAEKGILIHSDNMWYGSTVTAMEEYFSSEKTYNTFLSIEPMLSSISPSTVKGVKWVIIGAETGRRKNKVIPKKEWIERITQDCRRRNIPVFMKSSLAEIWGKPLVQEMPESLKTV